MRPPQPSLLSLVMELRACSLTKCLLSPAVVLCIHAGRASLSMHAKFGNSTSDSSPFKWHASSPLPPSKGLQLTCYLHAHVCKTLQV